MRVCPRCRSIFSTPADRCGLDGAQLIDTDEDPLIDQQVDQYKIIELLGGGAMGCVYRGKHAILSTDVAVKVLYGNFALNQRLVERFRREAQAIARMNHPNIVNVLDFRRTEAGLTFIAMELVQGRTLEKALAHERRFTAARTAAIARQIASGLAEAHRTGFVHRDMKPSNIMLVDSNGLETVKILDFGVVGLLHAASRQKLTVAGHIVGTPNYMAPEQARSSTVGPPADLYALGVIMFEMLEGRPPFEGFAVAEVLLKHINEAPPPLDVSSPALGKLVMSLLEKKPERRPASAQRVIGEIDRMNLDVASTEQILLNKVLAALPSRAKDNQRDLDTEDVQADEHPTRKTAPVRVLIPTVPSIMQADVVEDASSTVATPPDPSLPEMSQSLDPLRPTDPPPSEELGNEPPPIVPVMGDPTERLMVGQLDAPTQIDLLRSDLRPAIGAATDYDGNEGVVTARPEEPTPMVAVPPPLREDVPAFAETVLDMPRQRPPSPKWSAGTKLMLVLALALLALVTVAVVSVAISGP
jgi:serine/threonine-protein kinase